MSKVPTSHNYNSLKLARIRAGISQKETRLDIWSASKNHW